MEEVFIKIYVLVSLWLWAGMLLSDPLRKAFGDMHWRVAERIYDATWGRLEKASKRAIDSILRRFRKATLYMEDRTYELRVKVARSLISKELLDELVHKNLVAAISRARGMDQHSPGISYEDIVGVVHLGAGKQLSREAGEAAVKKSFELCDTDLFKEIVAKVPKAQERILVAFDRLEGRAPYDSVVNEEYRKFIRE